MEKHNHLGDCICDHKCTNVDNPFDRKYKSIIAKKYGDSGTEKRLAFSDFSTLAIANMDEMVE